MKKRVLVVDDDAAIRDSLHKVLEVADYDVVLVGNGQEAVDRCVSQRIDLMVLDLHLPGKRGWDAFEEVTRRNPCLPIIVLTGLANQYDFAVAAGVGALLEKPVDPVVLLQTVQELLAEPPEHRLLRLSGQKPDTRYAPSPNTRFLKKLREQATTPYHFQLPPTRWQGLRA
jgi:CheY-like chemotaxis protein